MKTLIAIMLFAAASVGAQTTNITVAVPTNAAAIIGTNVSLQTFMQTQVNNRVRDEQKKKLAVAFEKMTETQRFQLLAYIKANFNLEE